MRRPGGSTRRSGGAAAARGGRVVLVAFGELNRLLLTALARSGDVDEIVVATRRPEAARPFVNLVRVAAGTEGAFPSLRIEPFDLNETEAAAATLARLAPDVVFAAPSLQSWWVLRELPPAARARLAPAGYGAWLPLQLVPAARFMRAWVASGAAAPVVLASYPDVVIPVLATQGLAPTCGVGNLDEIVPKLRWSAARDEGTRPEEVAVRLVAHHALEPYAYRAAPAAEAPPPPPFLVRVEVEGRPVPEATARRWVLEPYAIPEGLEFHFLTVGSAVRLVRALLRRGETTDLHVPGPSGLPGGYPVRVGDGTVEIALAPPWTLEEAKAVNEASHRWDGIDAIEPDGTVRLTEATAGVLRDALGLDRPRIAFEEMDDAAEELRRRFEDYRRRAAGAS